MFGSEDQGAARAALNRLEEATLFLMTAAADNWHGHAATAAESARSQHIGLTFDAIARVQDLLVLLHARDDLRDLVSGGTW